MKFHVNTFKLDEGFNITFWFREWMRRMWGKHTKKSFSSLLFSHKTTQFVTFSLLANSILNFDRTSN